MPNNPDTERFNQLYQLVGGDEFFNSPCPDIGPCIEERALEEQAAIGDFESLDPTTHRHILWCTRCFKRYIKIRAENYFAPRQ